MVERCVGTGEDGLGKQLALFRRVNFGQRMLHLLSLVVIGRLGLVFTRGLRFLEIAVMWGLAQCGTDPFSNVGGNIRRNSFLDCSKEIIGDTPQGRSGTSSVGRCVRVTLQDKPFSSFVGI